MNAPQTGRRDLTIIAFTAFMNFIGLTIAFPIFTPLCLEPAGSILPAGASMPLRTTILGFLLGVFPLCQFFTSPLLGALSDRWGRKKVLLYSIVGSCGGHLIMAVGILAGSLPLVFLSRIISGCFSGSLAVTQSAIADLSTEKTRPKNFGLLGAAFGLSLFIGPALGGFLSDPGVYVGFSYATPFWIAAFLTGINFLQVAWLFSETLPQDRRRQVAFHLLVGPVNVIRAFAAPAYRKMFLVVLSLYFGFNFFTQFFQVYLVEKFSVSGSQLGIILSYLGICSILTQVLLVRPVSKRFTSRQVLPVSLLLLALSFPALLVVQQFWLLFPVILFIPLFSGLSNPNLTALVCGLAGKENQGEILGVNQSVMAMAQFVPPLIGGYIVGQHFTLPLWIAFASILLAWVLFLKNPSGQQGNAAKKNSS
jgi:DHA1 family tetracycline resistance protein-like MFS transporter